MEQQKRIIQIDDVKPGVSKKRKTGGIISAAAVVLIAAAVFIILSAGSGGDAPTLKSWDSAEVRRGSLVSTTEASGTVVLPTTVNISSTEDSYADRLLVGEGDAITGSDILAILDVPDLEDRRDELTVNLAQAEIELESIGVEYDYQRTGIELSLERLEDDIAEAETELVSAKKLLELSSSRAADYEEAEDNLEALLEEREDLILSLDENRIKKEISLRKQQAAIAQIEVSLRTTESDIADASIRSPIDGEVLSVNEDLAIPGSSIDQGDVLFIVADRNNSFIDFEVYEQYSDQLETGDRMTVTAGTDTFEAEIVKIGRIATMDSDGLSAMVTVRAKPAAGVSLTPGASAVASITLGVEDDVLLLPRGAYLTTGNRKWVYRVEDGKAYRTEVTYGSIEGTDVEIISGLEAGDRIITSSYQNFIDDDVVICK